MKNLSRILRSAAVLLGSLAILSGCGGGGGGGGDSASTTPSGLRVTVSDTYGVAVAGATVEATVGTSVVTETTGADGVALLIFSGATGTADVSVSRDTFITYTQPAAATVTANLVTDLPAITLVRKTSAAGGSLTSRSGVIPTVDSGKQTMTFEIELVIVGADSQPITGLTEGSFALEVCAPDPSNDRVDCVRGTATTSDVAYAPMTVPPQALTVVPGATAVPYAAALMLDQSGSIATSDPTAARLYSAKEFIGGLDASDRALLSAFTDSAAVIPDTPLTIYPPFRDLVTISSIAPAYFDTLDSLATLVGGGTPLYSALGELVAEVATDTSVFGLAKSVVIFTDGDDTTCGTPDACRLVRQTSISNANTEGIRIFTIGLTKQVNFEALGELANGTGGVFLFAESPEQLIPLYGSVGRLLSLSLPTYRLTWTVQATATDAFLPGNALLGNVTVTTGTSTFEVPFIVGIS